MVAAYVGGREPLHPAAQIAGLVRPENQVEVIGHQAVTEKPSPGPLLGLLDDLFHRLVVARFVK